MSRKRIWLLTLLAIAGLGLACGDDDHSANPPVNDDVSVLPSDDDDMMVNDNDDVIDDDDTTPPEPECEAGEETECACPDDWEGTSICGNDGFWGECECPGMCDTIQWDEWGVDELPCCEGDEVELDLPATYVIDNLLEGNIQQPEGIGPILQGIASDGFAPVILEMQAIHSSPPQLQMWGGSGDDEERQTQDPERETFTATASDWSCNPYFDVEFDVATLYFDGYALPFENVRFIGRVSDDGGRLNEVSFKGTIDSREVYAALGDIVIDPCVLLDLDCDFWVDYFITGLTAESVDIDLMEVPE